MLGGWHIQHTAPKDSTFNAAVIPNRAAATIDALLVSKSRQRCIEETDLNAGRAYSRSKYMISLPTRDANDGCGPRNLQINV